MGETVELSTVIHLLHSWKVRATVRQMKVDKCPSRYYFAFLLSEAVNNAAGLGFNGYDEKNPGIPRWNLVTNIKPFELERATSLKVVFDLWNMRKYPKDLENGRMWMFFVNNRDKLMASSSVLRSNDIRTNTRCFCTFGYLGKTPS